MFLSKFKKLKQKNKVLFNKAMKKPNVAVKGREGCLTDEPVEEEDSMEREEDSTSVAKNCAIPDHRTEEQALSHF